MHHSCSRYGVASCFPSRGSSGSRGIQRVLPQYAIGEPIFPYLLVLSLCISKGHAQIVDESGRPVTPLHNFDCRASDGTTPASRFFRRGFPDLFETVLSNVDDLPRPRKRNQIMALSG